MIFKASGKKRFSEKKKGRKKRNKLERRKKSEKRWKKYKKDENPNKIQHSKYQCIQPNQNILIVRFEWWTVTLNESWSNLNHSLTIAVKKAKEGNQNQLQINWKFINWKHSVSHNFYACDLHAKSHLCVYDRTKYINRVRIRFNLGHIFPQFVYLIHIHGVEHGFFQIGINNEIKSMKKSYTTHTCLFIQMKIKFTLKCMMQFHFILNCLVKITKITMKNHIWLWVSMWNIMSNLNK